MHIAKTYGTETTCFTSRFILESQVTGGCFFLKPRIGRIAKRRWSSIRCMSWFDPLWHSSQSWVFNWNMRPGKAMQRFQGDLWVPRCSQSYLMFFLLNNPRETYHSEGVIIVYSCNGNLETHSVFCHWRNFTGAISLVVAFQLSNMAIEIIIHLYIIGSLSYSL
jgi:hypothetical protein